MLSEVHSELSLTQPYSLQIHDAADESQQQNSLSIAPAISVTRPSRVSASMDDSALELLRAEYAREKRKQHRNNRLASLSAGYSRAHSSASLTTEQSRTYSATLPAENGLPSKSLLSTVSRSAQSLQRKNSFKVKKLKMVLLGTPSNESGSYESLNSDYADEASVFSLERVTSVNRAIGRNSSFTASSPCSPRLGYRAMTVVPAKNRIFQYFSSSDEEEEGGARPYPSDESPTSESDLDFGAGPRSRSSFVSCHVSRFP